MPILPNIDIQTNLKLWFKWQLARVTSFYEPRSIFKPVQKVPHRWQQLAVLCTVGYLSKWENIALTWTLCYVLSHTRTEKYMQMLFKFTLCTFPVCNSDTLLQAIACVEVPTSSVRYNACMLTLGLRVRTQVFSYVTCTLFDVHKRYMYFDACVFC
jgi:hypothetical protein